MAVYGGPEVVTDGLVLCLDGGNSRSYPGSGTVMTDLSSFANNGTLTNGPGYTASNGGAIVLDGTNDEIALPQTTAFNFGLGDFAVEIWFYPTSLTTVGGPSLVTLGPYFGTVPKGMLFFLQNNTGRPSLYTNSGYYGTTTAVTVNTWNQVVYTRVSGTVYTYVQTVPGNTFNLSTWSITTGSNNSIGSDKQYNGDYLTGRVSCVRIYNKSLTAAEVAQNFAATRGRFGI